MRQALIAALRQSGSAVRNPPHELSDRQLLEQFAARKDERAFEALVRRHGPMVQGVCRRILGDVHDAEDAFQAVFLVLVRKSGSIRKPDLLSNWLYGVAHRIARKARAKGVRKESRERRAGKMLTHEQLIDLEWAELREVLDDELSRLPEKYRAPLVLCYLRGQTNAQAAAQLGWPAGSISERLARAREMLRRRLNRRGLTLSAGLLALLLSQKAASATVSSVLVQSTVQAAVSYAAGTTAAAPSTVLSLAQTEATGSSAARLVKLFSLALTIAVAIALFWPTMKGFLELNQLFAGDGVTWRDQPSAFASGTGPQPGLFADPSSTDARMAIAMPATPVAGAHCSSSAK